MGGEQAQGDRAGKAKRMQSALHCSALQFAALGCFAVQSSALPFSAESTLYGIHKEAQNCTLLLCHAQ